MTGDIEKLTGFQLPSPIVSTGSRLTLWLLSDYAVSGQGFKAAYEAQSMPCIGNAPVLPTTRGIKALLELVPGGHTGGRHHDRRQVGLS
ncbi:unnamed protein product [Arctogadus glacialis]